MKVDAATLSSKVMEMFPEIGQSGVKLTISEMPDINSWEIRLVKDGKEMSACLAAKDAKDCLDGKECTAFDSEMRQFVHSYCRHSKECPVR